MDVKILPHGDTDGVCAAALVNACFPEADVWFSRAVTLLRDLQEKVEPGMKIFILDVAINEVQKAQIFDRIRELAENGEVIYIDHHPLPPDTLKKDLPVTQLVHSIGASTSALTFEFLRGSLNPDLDRVALWGAIADYTEGAEIVQAGLNKYDRRTIYMEAGLLSQALDEASGDYHYKREVVKKLSQGSPPSDIPQMVEYAVRATKREWSVWRYVKEHVKREDNIAIVYNLPSGSLGKAALYALGVTGSDIGICTRQNENEVDMSLRRRAGARIDLNTSLRRITARIGGSGGGHEAAAGATVPIELFNTFLDTFKKEVAPVVSAGK